MSVPTYPAPVVGTAGDRRRGAREPVEYVDELCDRVDAVDPDLRALVPECGRRERLREEAAALPDRFPGRDDRPPLYGVPVGVKDVVHVDGFTTRAGTALPPELFAGPQASCVTRLLSAGALVAGKTVTTEFAGRGPGLTRNPHDLDHTPGGSSSGSAAGVAAGLFPLALGTQTFGSVIRPAAFCGVVGMKPSFGRVPRDGVLPRSESADHVGMFAQRVAGVRVAASVLCADWSPVRDEPEWPPTVGVPRGPYLERASAEGRAAFEARLERLEAAGCSIVDVTVPTFEDFESLARRHRQVTSAELAAVHDDWFDDYELFYRTGMAERIREGRAVTEGQLAAARAGQTDLRDELEALRAEHDLDVWATPAAPGPAPATLRTTGNAVMNLPWTHAGLPAVTIPAGESDDGLPLGLQLVGGFDRDEALLHWAGKLAGGR